MKILTEVAAPAVQMKFLKSVVTVCDLKYPPSHSSEQCCSKDIDSWVHCDSYDDWFLKVRFPFDVDIEKDFICDGCL